MSSLTRVHHVSTIGRMQHQKIQYRPKGTTAHIRHAHCFHCQLSCPLNPPPSKVHAHSVEQLLILSYQMAADSRLLQANLYRAGSSSLRLSSTQKTAIKLGSDYISLQL